MTVPNAAAIVVLAITSAKRVSVAASVDAPLKPNQPNNKMITPSIAGNSIGNWEGDVLVVDTIGFKPGVLVPLTGLQHSAQMHAVERYTLDNTARTLTRDYRADDPLYLSDPFKGLDVMKMSDEPFTSYKCVELSGKNNIRPK